MKIKASLENRVVAKMNIAIKSVQRKIEVTDSGIYMA